MTTWADAIKDRTSVFHWLLLINVRGTIQTTPVREYGRIVRDILPDGPGVAPFFAFRFADAPLSITEGANQRFWEGVLEIQQPPSIAVDPFTMRASANNATVKIYPHKHDICSTAAEIRFQDYEKAYQFSWEQALCYLYRWAEGTTMAEADLVLVGTVDNMKIDSYNTTQFDIVDLSYKYNVKLPKKDISRKLFANSHEEDRGLGYPILYGAFAKTECPVIDTVNKYAMVAGHACASVTYVYFDDVAAAFTASTTTDSDGDTYQRITPTTETVVDKRVTASGTGIADTSAGKYTGTASALITHPADQLYHMAVVYAEIPEQYIDKYSFKNARVVLPSWTFATEIGASDEKYFFDIVQDVTQWMRYVMFFEKGLLTLKELAWPGPIKMKLDVPQIIQMEEISWGNKDNLCNRLRLKYHWGYSKKADDFKFKESVLVTEDDYQDFQQSQYKYGVQKKTYKNKHIKNDATAQNCANRISRLIAFPRKTARLTATPETHNLRVFDWITITDTYGPSATGAGWSNNRVFITGIEYGLYSNILTVMEA